jgi:UDP-N-acetylmuramate--alanine ligase
MEIELKSIKNRVFFVGVGGISMSALAKLCQLNGCVVAGSDAVKTAETIKLEQYFKVYYSHKESNIINFNPSLVVYTGAIKPDNPELNYAQKMGIKLVERSEFLGNICKNYNHVIAVAGTHGKTTTTAMIAEIFVKAGLNPTVHVGGNVVNLKGNLVVGDNNYFITEACEYKNSFKHIISDVAVITNVEADHMDCYSSFSELENAFINFSNNANYCVLNSANLLVEKVKNKGLILIIVGTLFLFAALFTRLYGLPSK